MIYIVFEGEIVSEIVICYYMSLWKLLDFNELELSN